jgi:hypothetical protein
MFFIMLIKYFGLLGGAAALLYFGEKSTSESDKNICRILAVICVIGWIYALTQVTA